MSTVADRPLCLYPRAKQGGLVRYRGRLTIYYVDEKGQSKRISTGTDDVETAREILRNWQALHADLGTIDLDKSAKRWLKERLRTASYNGKLRGFECTLTMDDMEEMYLRSGGRCEVSGIAFDLSVMVPGERNPYRISLDRKNSSLPYTPDNCRLVTVIVNYAMGEWGENVLREVSVAIAGKSAHAGFVAIQKAGATKGIVLPKSIIPDDEPPPSDKMVKIAHILSQSLGCPSDQEPARSQA